MSDELQLSVTDDTRSQVLDDSEPSPERKAELRAAYQANKEAGRAPYAGVRIRTLGEVAWIMAQHGWSGQEDEYRVKYTLIPAGTPVERADFQEAWLAHINLAGVRLRRANLRGANLVRANLASGHFVDADMSHADLGFADISNANLTWVNLTGAHLREVSLRNARLIFADLSGAGLARCDLRAANLRNARMDASTLLADVLLDTHTQVRDITWNGASLTKIEWDSIQRLGDEDIAHSTREPERKAAKNKLTRLQGAARAYQQLSVVLRSQGIMEAASRFAYRAQVLQRQVLRRQGRLGRWLGSLLLDLIAGYGYRPMRSFITYVFVVLGFAAIYYFLGPTVHPPLGLHDAIVFSIASFHGRGFVPGEMVTLHDPLTTLAAGEAIIGLLIEITFIATFTQRFFAR